LSYLFRLTERPAHANNRGMMFFGPCLPAMPSRQLSLVVALRAARFQ
jgi:hypothetical protein